MHPEVVVCVGPRPSRRWQANESISSGHSQPSTHLHARDRVGAPVGVHEVREDGQPLWGRKLRVAEHQVLDHSEDDANCGLDLAGERRAQLHAERPLVALAQTALGRGQQCQDAPVDGQSTSPVSLWSLHEDQLALMSLPVDVEKASEVLNVRVDGR